MDMNTTFERSDLCVRIESMCDKRKKMHDDILIEGLMQHNTVLGSEGSILNPVNYMCVLKTCVIIGNKSTMRF